MISRILSNHSIEILSRGLDAASLRQEVISNNIANVETPGFKASRVSFEDELRRALGAVDGSGPADGRGALPALPAVRLVGTNPRHIVPEPRGSAEVAPRVITDTASSMRNDGNNVDVEAQMAELAENTVLYNALVRQISAQFSNLRTAINEGRR